MAKNGRFLDRTDYGSNDLLNLSRIVTEVEYLVVLLVIFYIVVLGGLVQDKLPLIMASIVCTGFIIVFHYSLHDKLNRRLLAMEAVIMAGYITYVIWFTGKTNSPLIELYMITIVSSALMLGVVTTLLLAALIACCLLYFDYLTYSIELFSADNTVHLIKTVIILYTLMLVAYLTLMLSTHMERARNRIKLLSERDELTGLMNMRAFTTLIAREYKSSLRFHKEFAVLMIDADNLKTVNDHHGHTAGDQLIISISETLKDSVRSNDILARYGGDEFVVLLPETDLVGATTAAERLRTSVLDSIVKLDSNHAITTSISIGIAHFPTDSNDLEDIIQKADSALYISKSKGKNTSSLYRDINSKEDEASVN